MKLPETERLRAVYRKRDATKKYLYNPLDPGAFYLLTSRDRSLTQMLQVFMMRSSCSLADLRILDVGCGTGGVLRSLVSWGAQPQNLAGVDINQRILAVLGVAGSGAESSKITDDAETSASAPQAGV